MIVTLVQARMGSTRLPGKVLKPIDGRPMFSYQLERLRRATRNDLIVVATTVEPADRAIVDFCMSENVEYFRGSETDVLSRFHGAATKVGATIVVRVTSDCPLLDAELVDRAIEEFVNGDERFDYLSNMIEPSWPYGCAVEVMTFAALDEAYREATKPAEREHVTPFIYWRPERYRIKSLTMQPNLSHHRWTVDTPEDFELVTRILHDLYPRKPRFTLPDVLAVLAQHPDWNELNAHVEQKQALRT